MNKTLVIALRVLEQLRRDKKYLFLMLAAPFVVIFLLKTFMDTMPAGFPVHRYVMPITSFVIYFFSFLLCAIVLIQERTKGTLERLFINGCNRIHIMAGYTLGYLFLSTVVSVSVLVQVIFLFKLDYSWYIIMSLFAILWFLSIVSVMFGIFISTFARNEAQLFPFIPMVTLPAIFLSGMLVEVALLPEWAQWLSKIIPLYYANNVIQLILKPNALFSDALPDMGILALWAIILLICATFTFKEVE